MPAAERESGWRGGGEGEEEAKEVEERKGQTGGRDAGSGREESEGNISTKDRLSWEKRAFVLTVGTCL